MHDPLKGTETEGSELIEQLRFLVVKCMIP